MMLSPTSSRLPRRVVVVGSGTSAQQMAAVLSRLPGIGQVVQAAETPRTLLGVDAVVEMVGGVAPAFEIAMAALGQGIACFTTNPLLVAAHGRVLQAAALGQHTTFGWQGAVFGAPVKDFAAAETPRRMMAAWSGAPNQLLVRMGFRNENSMQARAQLRMTGADFSDIEGKHTAARLLGLAALAWPEWLSMADITRQTTNSLDLPDMKLVRHYGLQFVMGGVLERVKGSLVAYVGPLALPNGHPLTGALAGNDVLMVEDEITGGESVLTRPTHPMNALAGVVADMRGWLVKPACGAAQPLRNDEGWSLRPNATYMAYARGPYLLRALLAEDLGATLLQDRVEADGLWTGIVATSTPWSQLRSQLDLPAESLLVPLMGEWEAEMTGGLRLVA